MKKINGVIMQYFEWYLETNQNLWNEISKNAENLAKIGITALWLPPAYKGIGGKDEVGYGVYDLYDLGEFDQKETIKTKYGSKEEYISCILSLKQAGIESYADIVLNHKMGADMLQTIPAEKVDWGNHNEIVSGKEIVRVATKFTFPGRKKKYSDFEWNWTHFDGIDYNDKTKEHAIFKFINKEWANEVDEEFGNFDYLMGADIDFQNEEVREELLRWGKWYIETTDVDGFRLDAVKHINAEFYEQWLKELRKDLKEELFAVGEYWSGDVSKLHRYITETNGETSLFDVPLHYNFYNASRDENYDLTQILDKTLMKENPSKAVTFVDNHDTQPEQSLQSYVERWFKLPAYSIILLRDEGYPCVFYGDFYGIKHNDIEKIEGLKEMITIRKEKAYGKQNDYFDNPSCIGWTREGDEEHIKSGVAVLISNKYDSEKRMYIGKNLVGEEFIDAIGNCEEKVIIDEEGFGNFKVKAKSVSVWVR
ncbi:MAG: alpha-amylase [Clostridia bacterium]